MTNIIQDGDGRLFEVVEGELTQDEQYVLVWQDIAAAVDANEADGMTRADALDAALIAAGRKAVFVQRIPNAVDPGPSDGVSRIYFWNTDGTHPRPGFMGRALERPSKGFYERCRAEAQAMLDAANAQGDSASIDTIKTTAAAAIAAAEAAIAAIDALPSDARGHSVEVIDAKIAETRAARG